MGGASYAVVWCENGEPHSGRLELGHSELRLLGSGSRTGAVRLEIAYRDLLDVRVGRSPAERLNRAPSVILERRSGVPLTIGALNGVGIIFELADVLTDLAARAASSKRVAIVIPLSPNGCARARELVEAGPPFDISALPLDRHDVYVTDAEILFVFEGSNVQQALTNLVRDPQVWRSAAAWKECIGGRPRLGEAEYSWTRH
jgi:hypothetical protein